MRGSEENWKKKIVEYSANESNHIKWTLHSDVSGIAIGSLQNGIFSIMCLRNTDTGKRKHKVEIGGHWFLPFPIQTIISNNH